MYKNCDLDLINSPRHGLASSAKLRSPQAVVQMPCRGRPGCGRTTSSGFRQRRQSEARGPTQERQDGWQSGGADSRESKRQRQKRGDNNGNNISHCGRWCPGGTAPPHSPPHTAPGGGGGQLDTRSTGTPRGPNMRHRSRDRLEQQQQQQKK